MDTAIGIGFRGILDPIISLILIGTLKGCIILLSFFGMLVRIFQFTIIDGFVKSPPAIRQAFDKLTVLSKVEALTTLSKAEGLPCTASPALLI